MVGVMKRVVVTLAMLLVLATVDKVLKPAGDPTTIHRYRMFKFALFQDVLIVLRVAKMMLLEGYTWSGVVARVRAAGLVTHVYLGTAGLLHAALLLDEPAAHAVRLNPVPYTPPTLDQAQKDLFWV